MASFTPSKKTASDFNNNTKYVDYDPALGITGDSPQAETINNLVESALYTQERADSAAQSAANAESSADNANSAAEAAQKTADGKYTLPAGGIPASDLKGDIPTSKITGLATVATSGDYNDLLHKPAAYSLPIATSTVLGGVKSSTTGTDGTDYNVQVNADGTMKVNVPSPDLSGYARLDGTQEFTGKNTFTASTTFTETDNTGNYTNIDGASIGVVSDYGDIATYITSDGIEIKADNGETNTEYQATGITYNHNDNTNTLSFPQKSGTLFLKEEFKAAEKAFIKFEVGDYFITGNTTSPAARFGGTWEELPQGTFLRATGTSGAISSGTATDGGSNSHNHVVGAQDDTSAYAIMDTGIAVIDGTNQRGVLTRTSQVHGYSSDLFMFIDNGAATFREQTNSLDRVVQVVGSTKSANNEPLYKNVHIWRKIS